MCWLEIRQIRKKRGKILLGMAVNTNAFVPLFCRLISREEAENFAKDIEVVYIETSAKSGHNIKHLFQVVASLLPGN